MRSAAHRGRHLYDSNLTPPSLSYGSISSSSECSSIRSAESCRRSVSPSLASDSDMRIDSAFREPEKYSEKLEAKNDNESVRKVAGASATGADVQSCLFGNLGGKHHRNLSSMTTSSRINKRFSIQPQPPSPTGSVFDNGEQKQDALVQDVVGEEPGINVDTMDVKIPDGVGSQVTIVDYCESNLQKLQLDIQKGSDSRISGSSDYRMLGKRLDEVLIAPPSWGRVRWIIVNGLSWEVIRPIAVKYSLHPLALEDMLDIPQRTKVEVFHEHIFCCFPLHTLQITPTPFSLLHRIARKCVLEIYQLIVQVRLLFSMVSGFFIYLYSVARGWFDRLQASHTTDAERQQHMETVCTVHGVAHVRAASISSSDISSTSKSDIRDGKSSTVAAEVHAGSQSSHSTLAMSEGDVCIPFYTSGHGTLCSNNEKTPVEAQLRELPVRSLYEWNRGNLALHEEALQNMRIQGSANSVEIALEQVSLFVLPNTVITFFEKSAPTVCDPIMNRLASPYTILRQSSDACFLVQAMLDTSVDLVRPILGEYRAQLSRLQFEGIYQPNIRHTRALHAFMTDLTMMRTLVRSLVSLVDALRSKSIMQELSGKSCDGRARGEEQGKSMSSKAVEYLADVSDHAEAYLEDLDGMHLQSQTLNSLIFDTISIRAGDSVKMLSLVSVIFLPLTFLTGYFGMNFKSFTTLDNDVGYYWLVSAPAAAALTVILMYPTLKSQLNEWWSWAKLQV